MIGRTLAHYRVTEKIGAGGMGEVYRATDTKLGRDVALKMLPPAFAQDAERMARFQREAQVLASLNHPNIGAIYGLDEHDGSRFLVLELIEGPTLFDRLTAGRLPQEEAFAIARQIAEAVEFAHESGVVHRDLKPSNIKVTADGRVKVLDFGLAKALEDPASSASGADPANSPTMSPTLRSPITGALTGPNVILGTAAYMSPEQARGKSVDKRADIWAFGVILFEMLTGRSLFAGESVSDTLAGVLKTDPDWSALPPDTQPRIVRLLRRCLERNPRGRLRDIGDARILIAEAIDGAPDEDASRAAAPAGTDRAASPRWFAPLLLALGLAAGATIGWVLKPSSPAPPVTRFLIAAAVDSEEADEPAISPDGRRVAYVLSDRIHVRDLDRIEPRIVEGSDGARAPFWSPDGEWLAFHADGKLWKVGAAGGQPTTICDLKGMREASWQDDGTIVFDDGRKLQRISAHGGDPELLRELPGEEARDLHGVDGLPGGRAWVVVAHYDDGSNTLEVWTESGEQKKLLEYPDAFLVSPRYAPPGHLLYERSDSNEGIWALPFSASRLEATGDPFLVVPGGGHPSVSDEGTLVSVPGNSTSDHQLVWVGLDGSIGEAVGRPQEVISRPALSPDGSKVVVIGKDDSKSDLWVHDLARSTKMRLTFGDGDELSPVWSTDGTLIYFTQDDAKTTIRRVAADGSSDPEEIIEGGFQSLSADGVWMAFERDGDQTGLDLWKWSLSDGGEPEVFLATPADEENVLLSPDGRWAAYESDESGGTEIYVRPFPSGSGKWQVSVDGGRGQKWSPEGDRLFFVKTNQLFRVDVETGTGLRLSSPQLVVDGSENDLLLWKGYSLLQGSDRFIAVRRGQREDKGDKSPPGIRVVQNWLAEFS